MEGGPEGAVRDMAAGGNIHCMTNRIVEPRAALLWASLVVTIALEVVLGRLNQPLQSAVAPLGIVSFELARTGGVATAILASWSEAARVTARTSLLVDYLFLVAYPASLWLGCRAVAARVQDRWPRVAIMAVALGWGAVVAGALDAVENAALLMQLSEGASATMAGVAFWSASAKFALVLVALPLALPALVPWTWPTERG